MLEALPEEDLHVGDASTKQEPPPESHPPETTAPNGTSSQENKTNSHDNHDSQETIQGVIFGRSVRGHYASLNLVMMECDARNPNQHLPIANNSTNHHQSEDQYHVLVRIQFDTPDDAMVKDLRSYFRRYCKNGDLVRLHNGRYQDCLFPTSSSSTSTDDKEDGWAEPRFVIHVQSIQQAQASLQVQKVRFWAQSQWQGWQNKYYRQGQQQQQRQKNRGSNSKNAASKEKDNACQAHHAGGLEKRQQSEMVAKFVFQMMMTTLQEQQVPRTPADDRSHPTTSPMDDADTSPSHTLLHAQTLKYLNGGSGVLDVAGGSGLVSMALGLMGIPSTVVDPREAVGRLPGRDRKVYHRALKQQQKQQQQQQQGGSTTTKDISEQRTFTADTPSVSSPILCQPVMTTTTPLVQVRPFQTMRAWFGTPPDGIDSAFRNPDNAAVPVCDAQHALLRDCRVIVGLHTDEATDAIVDTAVHCRKPFVIVPCCVFCRLFPNRRMPSGEMVSSYQQLLDYLQAKHPSIQRTTLPFVGANTVLYSTFQ